MRFYKKTMAFFKTNIYFSWQWWRVNAVSKRCQITFQDCSEFYIISFGTLYFCACSYQVSTSKMWWHVWQAWGRGRTPHHLPRCQSHSLPWTGPDIETGPKRSRIGWRHCAVDGLITALCHFLHTVPHGAQASLISLKILGWLRTGSSFPNNYDPGLWGSALGTCCWLPSFGRTFLQEASPPSSNHTAAPWDPGHSAQWQQEQLSPTWAVLLRDVWNLEFKGHFLPLPWGHLEGPRACEKGMCWVLNFIVWGFAQFSF